MGYNDGNNRNDTSNDVKLLYREELNDDEKKQFDQGKKFERKVGDFKNAISQQYPITLGGPTEDGDFNNFAITNTTKDNGLLDDRIDLNSIASSDSGKSAEQYTGEDTLKHSNDLDNITNTTDNSLLNNSATVIGPTNNANPANPEMERHIEHKKSTSRSNTLSTPAVLTATATISLLSTVLAYYTTTPYPNLSSATNNFTDLIANNREALMIVGGVVTCLSILTGITTILLKESAKSATADNDLDAETKKILAYNIINDILSPFNPYDSILNASNSHVSFAEKVDKNKENTVGSLNQYKI